MAGIKKFGLRGSPMRGTFWSANRHTIILAVVMIAIIGCIVALVS